MHIEYRPPWLIATLDAPMRALSWAPHRAGLVDTKRIAWREVRDADLTPHLDVPSWLAGELEREGLSDAVTFLTSRSLARYHRTAFTVGETTVTCVATVGLGNAERIGHRVGPNAPVGTINVLVEIAAGLSDAARIEAIAMAAEAKTAAVTDVAHALPTGTATGTGTDCIIVAAPEGEETFVGKHTDIGEALGRAVYDAVLSGAREWMAEQR